MIFLLFLVYTKIIQHFFQQYYFYEQSLEENSEEKEEEYEFEMNLLAWESCRCDSSETWEIYNNKKGRREMNNKSH